MDIKAIVLLYIFGFCGKYLFQVLKYLIFAVNCMIIVFSVRDFRPRVTQVLSLELETNIIVLFPRVVFKMRCERGFPVKIPDLMTMKSNFFHFFGKQLAN